MIRTFRVLTVVSLAAMAAACTTESDSTDGNSAEDLTGRTFVSTSVTGTQIPGDGPMVVEFPEDGRISATAGCNRFVGGVDLADGRVKASDLASTMMACLPEREGADAWLTTLFDAEPRWSLDGNTFTLTGDDITVSLEDEKVADPALPITGTEWVVTSLRTADASSGRSPWRTPRRHSPWPTTAPSPGTRGATSSAAAPRSATMSSCSNRSP